MDILKKMFSKSRDDKHQTQSKDDFRKPTWFDDYETDDDDIFDSKRKFIFQMFTSPLELQKYFDQQMLEVLKSLKDYEDESGEFDRNFKDEYLKPGFEENFLKEFKKQKDSSVDTDLDGEIYADQLHSLLQRLSPELKSILSENNKKRNRTIATPKQKLSDEEKIMAMIHGTFEEDTPQVFRRKDMIMPKLPPHFSGILEGTYDGPKFFSQSVMTQTIRKPDGTCEIKKIIRDADGKVKTTTTRIVDGKKETITTYDNNGSEKKIPAAAAATTADENSEQNSSTNLQSERNIYVSKSGYALPKNIW